MDGTAASPTEIIEVTTGPSPATAAMARSGTRARSFTSTGLRRAQTVRVSTS